MTDDDLIPELCGKCGEPVESDGSCLWCDDDLDEDDEEDCYLDVDFGE